MTTRTIVKTLAGSLALMGGLSFTAAEAKDTVFVGHLADLTGPTAFVGKPYAEGVADALKYINENGGIQGIGLEFETVDYAYKVPQAIATYKRWNSRKNMVALQGWGTGDTEALISFVAKDQVATFSASYSPHLTDPTGKNPHTKKPAPYNYFYGPSYADGARALIQWAADDWQSTGKSGNPGFVFVGANHPYPESMREAAESRAKELGFDVKTNIVSPLGAGDKTPACLRIKESGVDYIFNGNLGGAVLALMKSCKKVGVSAKVLSNIWGVDRNFLEALQPDQPIMSVAATPTWESDAPGMNLVKSIAKLSDPSGAKVRSHHYIRGVCGVFYMKEAMEWAQANGGITGANIKQGMYQKAQWVPTGLEGVCQPSTWTSVDHRGTMNVRIIAGSFNNGQPIMDTNTVIQVDRRDDWLGR